MFSVLMTMVFFFGGGVLSYIYFRLFIMSLNLSAGAISSLLYVAFVFDAHIFPHYIAIYLYLSTFFYSNQSVYLFILLLIKLFFSPPITFLFYEHIFSNIKVFISAITLSEYLLLALSYPLPST